MLRYLLIEISVVYIVEVGGWFSACYSGNAGARITPECNGSWREEEVLLILPSRRNDHGHFTAWCSDTG